MVEHAAYLEEQRGKQGGDGPLTAEMFGFYSALFRYQASHCQRYAGESLPDLNAAYLPIAEKGKEIFLGDGILRLLKPGLAPLLELMSRHHPGLNLEHLGRALAAEGVLQDFAGAILDKDPDRIGQLAMEHKTGTDEAIFVLINLLKPFFAAWREKNHGSIPEDSGSRFCPFCGHYPDMSAIVAEKEGRRFLHCSLCEHSWLYKRVACAVCGSEEMAKLEYYTLDDDTCYRIDACHSCKGYIKTVRLDKFEDFGACDLTVENILTPHLDSAALKKGFRLP
jgi:formate dehydrogenase maturation protein FdhE